MVRLFSVALLLVGLVPATLHAAPIPTYASSDAGADLTRSHFGARYYAQRAGRFTTVDPLMNTDPALTDPQQWSRRSGSRVRGRISDQRKFFGEEVDTTPQAVLERLRVAGSYDEYREAAEAIRWGPGAA